jgi:ABC-type multidrug transport system ATPase subunit
MIHQAMINVMKNRTTFVIAHRLSTVREAHHIVVLKEGQIVEQGTHDGLLAQGGIYREIYDLQLQPQEEMLLDAPINNPVDPSSAGDTPGGGSPRLATDTGGDN